MSMVKLSGSRFEVREFLNRPISTFGCVLGWVLATVTFLGVTAWIGGPVEGDAALSIFTTWAIAHGHVACSYPTFGLHNLPSLARPNAFLPPLYPLLSAGVLFAVHSTYNVPFPTSAHLGSHCLTASGAIFNWAVKAHAILPTIR